MLFTIDHGMTALEPMKYSSIRQAIGKNEKDLENTIAENIGNLIFPEYLVFGNERSFQKEADIFAIDESGNLVVFELKVDGQYDRGKIYQALNYAQIFSNWQYEDMNNHYKKCFPKEKMSLSQSFENHFGFKLDDAKYNRKQKIVIISNGSTIETRSVSEYWKQIGVDIQEYFYRIYDINNQLYFEISNELYTQQNSNHCWINTCERYIKGAYIDMIKNNKASAYDDTIYVISDDMKGAYVFLYLNGYGIVGAGIGTANIKEVAVNNGTEKFIILKEFIHGYDVANNKIKHSINPSKIKKLLNQDFWFATTKVALSKENAEKLFNECKVLFK